MRHIRYRKRKREEKESDSDKREIYKIQKEIEKTESETDLKGLIDCRIWKGGGEIDREAAIEDRESGVIDSSQNNSPPPSQTNRGTSYHGPYTDAGL